MEGDVQGVMRRPEGNNPNEEAERDKWYHEILRDLSEPIYADDLLPSARILWMSEIFGIKDGNADPCR